MDNQRPQQLMGKKEIIVRDFFENHHGGRVSNELTVQQLYTQFMTGGTDATGISYGLFNGVVKKIRFETGDSLVPPPGLSSVARSTANVQASGHIEDDGEDPEMVEVANMDFPAFSKWVTGEVIDKLMSDHDEEGGAISGTANIVIGESGVGKTTILLDFLAKVKARNPQARILYLSSEMTQNDLYFYWQKMPLISSIPTILLMNYLQGRFDRTLEKAIRGEYDICVIDSHQDIIVKLKDVLGWKSTRAETWLTNLIIEAADKRGKTIFAIQHMTKGGEYVGSTYLKHATTSMMEIKFDEAKRRYVEFSKNRRGGSMINKRLYYSLAGGKVVWDEAAWRQENEAQALGQMESDRRQELEAGFNNLFLSVNKHRDGIVTTPEQLETEAAEEEELTQEEIEADVLTQHGR